MNRGSQVDQLIIPRRNEFIQLIQAESVVEGVLKQAALLFDYSLVINQRLGVCRMERGRAAIQKSSSRLRNSAHHVELICGKSDRANLSHITSERLATIVDEDLPGVSGEGYSQLSTDFALFQVSVNRSAALSKFYGLLQALRAKRFRLGQQMNGFEPVAFSLSIIAVENIEAFTPDDPAS